MVRTVPARGSLSVALAVAFALGWSGGCRQLNASHCGNQAGDATCAERNPDAPYCSVCVALDDGCMVQPVSEPGCGFGGGGTEPGSTSSPPPGSTSTSTSTSPTSSSGPLDSSSSSGVVDGTGSICGDQVIGPDEACDGSSLPPGASCGEKGSGMGLPSCEEDCSALDYTTCPGVQVCGNETIEGDEECDGSALAGQECSDYEGLHGTGLVCTPECILDSSACTGCVLSGDQCVMDDDCCDDSEVCRGLLWFYKTCKPGAGL